MDLRRRVRISKLLSLVLRHKPDVAGVRLDEQGWVSVDRLLEGLARRGPAVSRRELEEVAAASEKRRLEFGPGRATIRASQGHSVPVDLGYEPAEPPELLYHGTAERNVPSIRAKGLLRGRRHHVHLSVDEPTARNVGRRYGRPVVLPVRAGRMRADGFTFFVSANGVWLTDHVPTEYIALPEGDPAPAQQARGPLDEDDSGPLPEMRSCGVILFREAPVRAFLLMKHARRYDLPKGHVEPGESDLDCALRELEEETGIAPDCVRIDRGFRYERTYCPRYKRLGGRRVRKTLVIFLAWLVTDAEVVPSEHEGFEWIEWSPPHHIQAKAIDPLLRAIAHHMET